MKKAGLFTVILSLTISPFTKAAPLGPLPMTERPGDPLPTQAPLQENRKSPTHAKIPLKTTTGYDDSAAWTYLKSEITPYHLTFHARLVGIGLAVFLVHLLTREPFSWKTLIFGIVASSIVYRAELNILDNNLWMNFTVAACFTGFLSLIETLTRHFQVTGSNKV